MKSLRRGLDLTNPPSCKLSTKDVSVIVPTYRRGQVLIDTLNSVRQFKPAASELLVVDQTARHDAEIEKELYGLSERHEIRWIRLPRHFCEQPLSPATAVYRTGRSKPHLRNRFGKLCSR